MKLNHPVAWQESLFCRLHFAKRTPRLPCPGGIKPSTPHLIYDCVNGEVFSFDAIVLKENNLRIFFNDTSTSAGFPTADWRISSNDSANGGKSYFRIDDVTNDIGMLTIRDGGNVGIGTDDPAARLHVAGDVTVDGVVNELSDVNAKREIAPVTGEEILTQLSKLPIATWSYRSDAVGARHMGPMAQDFYAAFGLGVDECHLAAVDTGGLPDEDPIQDVVDVFAGVIRTSFPIVQLGD